MRCTTLLLPGEDPDLYVAFVPALDVVTQGEGIEGALLDAREASILAVRGMIEDGEVVPIEAAGAVVETIDVPVSVAAETTA